MAAPKRRRPRRRKPPPGNTTRVGLGAPHQAARRALLAVFREGDPCPYAITRQCKYADGRMWSWQALDCDDYPPRALGGGQHKRLAHARCNRAAGARLGNALQQGRIVVRRR
jgi:hypothetical protein